MGIQHQNQVLYISDAISLPHFVGILVKLFVDEFHPMHKHKKAMYCH